MGAILTFLGGSVFRMIFGEISSWLTKAQDQKYELQRLQMQAELDDKQHQRNQEAIRLQHELGVKTIEVQGEADSAALEMQGWANAVASATKSTGIAWVDAWNGMIRPAAATICLFLWVVALNAQGFTMTDWDKELVGVILGFFFAHRFMQARGK